MRSRPKLRVTMPTMQAMVTTMAMSSVAGSLTKTKLAKHQTPQRPAKSTAPVGGAQLPPGGGLDIGRPDVALAEGGHVDVAEDGDQDEDRGNRPKDRRPVLNAEAPAAIAQASAPSTIARRSL